MKNVALLLIIILALSFSSCTYECDCEVLEDGTIECPC